MMTRCEVSLIGSFRVSVDGRTLPSAAWRHRRGADLVKLLALADRRRLHREQVMDAVWPRLAADAAAANLRKAVHYARRALGTPSAITTDGEMVTLWPDGDVIVDVVEFERAARQSVASGDVEACARLADRYRGELLPEDRYLPWVEVPREHLRRLQLEVLKSGRMWERALEVDAADEEAHRALMQLALDSGDRGGAIRQFERLRQRLRVDLGVGPDEASVALYERALTMGGHDPPTAAEQARAHVARGLVDLNNGDLDAARRQAAAARALAMDAALGREIGEASALLGLVAHAAGEWKALFRSEFTDAVRTAAGLAAPVFDAHLCLAEFWLCGPAGHEELGAYARDLLASADEADSLRGRALATLILGEADLFSDRLDDADARLRAAADLHEQAGATGGQALATQRLAEVALARGQRRRADRLLQRAHQLAGASLLEPHLLVRVLAGRVALASRPAAARDAVGASDRALAGRDVCPPCSMGFRIASAMALARAGQLGDARRRIDHAERLAGMWQGGPWRAAAWEARAVLRAAEGHREQAAALFREAAEQFTRVGRPRDSARCLAATS